jgi:hypothetical protein
MSNNTPSEQYSEEAQTIAKEIMGGGYRMGDVEIIETEAELVGGGTTTVGVPQLNYDKDSTATSIYQDFREGVLGGEIDAVIAGEIYGESMDAVERGLSGCGETDDYIVEAKSSERSETIEKENPSGVPEGVVRNVASNVNRDLEDFAEGGTQNPAYRFWRAINKPERTRNDNKRRIQNLLEP